MKKKKIRPKIIKKKKSKKPANNNLPNNVTQEEFLVVLDNIAKRLGHKFKFGYHDFDDMKQQAAIFALEGLEKYDRSRPLENFLWTHVRNRLFNYKRDNYQRPDKPCLTCPFFDKNYSCSNNQCSKFLDKNECDLYSNWNNRNSAKKNIMQPNHFDGGFDVSHHKQDFQKLIQSKEIIEFLDANISMEYREFYLKIKHGTKIPKYQLIKLQQHVSDLMETTEWKNNHPKNEDN